MIIPEKCQGCVLIASLQSSIAQVEELKKFYLTEIMKEKPKQEDVKPPEEFRKN